MQLYATALLALVPVWTFITVLKMLDVLLAGKHSTVLIIHCMPLIPVRRFHLLGPLVFRTFPQGFKELIVTCSAVEVEEASGGKVNKLFTLAVEIQRNLLHLKDRRVKNTISHRNRYIWCSTPHKTSAQLQPQASPEKVSHR